MATGLWSASVLGQLVVSDDTVSVLAPNFVQGALDVLGTSIVNRHRPLFRRAQIVQLRMESNNVFGRSLTEEFYYPKYEV